ncbi:type VI secretion system protein ImpA [Andreprevotia lacus DSM 23236]|jgi:type VI secretion system protein ImpA|uniref:Type VI secretion system protein ImpA n=1 Tax=Andreprevotia lacus DSM 23236 TaxID=1121001 RepID=A0A1W1Y163_9NEIS|nr:type VI secretion system protein TssA [Andreprevotia lacus]SMC29541.1 type VI secretion system protein ImpA [Andreprevotia lacus DSM 23236]
MTQPVSALITSLLAPVSDALPAGADLEYSSEFLRLNKAAQPKPEQQYGSTVIPAEPADWGEVAQLAEQLLGQSKDLRIASLLTQAWTEQRGLAGLSDGLQLVQGLLDQYWDALHPRLEDDGEYDPLPRHNALARLFDGQGCLLALRASPLAAASGLLLREIDQLLDGVTPDRLEYPGGRDRLRGELTRAWHAGEPQLQSLPVARQSLAHIVHSVHTHLGDDWRPDAAALEKLLARLYEAAAGSSTQPPAAEDDVATVSADMTGPAPAHGITDWHAMEVRSREDINVVLEKVCLYLDRYEPSHPAPILLRRAQRLMQMGFYDILRDIAPDSLPQVDVFIGRPL